MLVVLVFFELVAGVIAEVDLVDRTIRSGEQLLIFLGVSGTRRIAVPVTFLVAATNLDAPNGVEKK